MTATHPTTPPWAHALKAHGAYELRFNNRVIAEVFWPGRPRMEAVLIRDMVDGLNAGYAARHAAKIGVEGAGHRETPETAEPEDTTTSRSVASPSTLPRTTLADEGITTYDTVPEVAERIVDVAHRSYHNGAGIAHQAYLDEVTNRPDIPFDAESAA